MKEQLHLTNPTQPFHNGGKEVIFMADEGQAELLPQPEEVEVLPPGKEPPPKISPPEQKPEETLPRIPSLEKISTTDLQEEYKRLGVQSSKSREDAQKLQPILAKYIDELKRRGFDVARLFKEFRKELPKEEKPKEGPGTPPKTGAKGVSYEERIEDLRKEHDEAWSLAEEVKERLGKDLLGEKISREDFEHKIGLIDNELTFENKRIAAEMQALFWHWERARTPGETEELRRRMAEIDAEPEAGKKREDAEKFINDFPIDHFLPDEVLKFIAEVPERTEYFLDRIISEPYDTPAMPYRLKLYAETNLSNLLDRVKVRELAIPKEQRKYLAYRFLESMSHSFHEMHRSLVSQTAEEYVPIAQYILPEDFEALKEIAGLSKVWRDFEWAYKKMLREKKTIGPDEYDEIFSLVEKSFHEAVEKGKVQSKFGGKIRFWEEKRALAIGRNLFAVTFQAPQYVCLGKLPKYDDERFGSFPYEGVARLFNHMKWIEGRFFIGLTRGGQDILDGESKEYQAELEKKYGERKLEEVGGLSRQELEQVNLTGVRGALAGWRSSLANLRAIPIDLTGVPDECKRNLSRYISLGEFIQEKLRELKEDEPFKKYSQEQKDEWLVKAFRPLLPQVNVSLGVLLEYETLPMEIKIELWKRLAKLDPLTMIHFLESKIKGEGETILARIKRGVTKEQWETFEEKLLLAREDRLNQELQYLKTCLQNLKEGEAFPQRPAEFDYLTLPEFADNDKEKELLGRIREATEIIAPELTKIEFPHAPFMDDVLLEMLNWKKIGAIFFRRRGGSEMLNWYRGQEARTKIIDNPGQPLETIRGWYKEYVDNIGMPLGVKTAQNRGLPLAKTFFRFIKKSIPGRTPVLGQLLALFRRPTSTAQEYYGSHAASLDESELWNQTELWVLDGSVRYKKLEGEKESQVKSLRRRIGALPINVLWDYIRSGTPWLVAFFLYSLGRELIREERR